MPAADVPHVDHRFDFPSLFRRRNPQWLAIVALG
jgi:hypothetical protein